MIAGGGNPLSNHYSQYLQTRVLTEWLRRSVTTESVNVFFGAGNTTPDRGFPDVHVVRRAGGGELHGFVPGSIEGNQPARHSRVRAFFGQDSVRRAKGNLFLFVGDHGIPGGDDHSNNCIVLWSPNTRSHPESECLSVSQLRALLERLSVRRTVFAMSQCYSGGFHQLGVRNGSDGLPTASGRVCGFTSTTPFRLAAGCTPDVESDRYQGYERTFTEQLTGRNIVSGASLRSAPPGDLRAVHRRAALLDMTIDIPLSTTEYFLVDWSDAISRASFHPREGPLSASQARRLLNEIAFGRLKGSALLEAAGPLRDQAADLAAYIAELERALGAADPELRPEAQNGAQLKQRMNHLENAIERTNAQWNHKLTSLGALRTQRLYPPWQQALRSGQSGLAGEALSNFEPPLLARELRLGGRPNWQRILEQTFLSELHALTLRDPAVAGRYARYFSERDEALLQWAESGNNLNLGETVQALRETSKHLAELQDRSYRLDQLKAYAVRLQYMRTALGALVTLGAMRDARAVSELEMLRACETTRLPLPGG